MWNLCWLKLPVIDVKLPHLRRRVRSVNLFPCVTVFYDEKSGLVMLVESLKNKI